MFSDFQTELDTRTCSGVIKGHPEMYTGKLLKNLRVINWIDGDIWTKVDPKLDAKTNNKTAANRVVPNDHQRDRKPNRSTDRTKKLQPRIEDTAKKVHKPKTTSRSKGASSHHTKRPRKRLRSLSNTTILEPGDLDDILEHHEKQRTAITPRHRGGARRRIETKEGNTDGLRSAKRRLHVTTSNHAYTIPVVQARKSATNLQQLARPAHNTHIVSTLLPEQPQDDGEPGTTSKATPAHRPQQLAASSTSARNPEPSYTNTAAIPQN